MNRNLRSIVKVTLPILIASGGVLAGIPSRPNAPLTGPVIQKSALPTAPSKLKGQVGGATNQNQKSLGSLGGSNAPPGLNHTSLKVDNSQQPPPPYSVNTTASQK